MCSKMSKNNHLNGTVGAKFVFAHSKWYSYDSVDRLTMTMTSKIRQLPSTSSLLPSPAHSLFILHLTYEPSHDLTSTITSYSILLFSNFLNPSKMRTRSRNNQVNLEPPPEPLPFPDAPEALHSAVRDHRTSRAMPLGRFAASNPNEISSLRSDNVLRNIAFIGIVGAVALTFLNIFLYTAIFVVGLLAPAWQTFKALEARDAIQEPNVEVIEVSDDEDDADYLPPGTRRPSRTARKEPEKSLLQNQADSQLRNWQTYWVMAALLFAGDALLLAPAVCRVLPQPVYAAGLFAAVAWLTRYRGGNARAVYTAFVRPAFLRSEEFVDKAVEGMLGQLEAVSSSAIVQINAFVTPYARQLEHAAAMTGKQLKDHANGRLRELRRRTYLS